MLQKKSVYMENSRNHCYVCHCKTAFYIKRGLKETIETIPEKNDKLLIPIMDAYYSPEEITE